MWQKKNCLFLSRHQRPVHTGYRPNMLSLLSVETIANKQQTQLCNRCQKTEKQIQNSTADLSHMLRTSIPTVSAAPELAAICGRRFTCPLPRWCFFIFVDFRGRPVIKVQKSKKLPRLPFISSCESKTSFGKQIKTVVVENYSGVTIFLID